MLLTPHFTLEELTYSDTALACGIDNAPDEQARNNLVRLAQVLEQVRALLDGCSITITSGYRCPALNSQVGGASNSAHLYGLACDWVCPEFGNATEICRYLEDLVTTLGIDQLIWEYGDWVHLGLSAGDPRGQCLTIDEYGTREGF